MARVKRGFKARRRRNRIREEAKGFRGGRSKLWKVMVETVRHAWTYSTRDRKRRKRDFRRLWIIRINAAARELGVSYSVLMDKLQSTGVALDRKMLADLATNDKAAFRQIVEQTGLLQKSA